MVTIFLVPVPSSFGNNDPMLPHTCPITKETIVPFGRSQAIMGRLRVICRTSDGGNTLKIRVIWRERISAIQALISLSIRYSSRPVRFTHWYRVSRMGKTKKPRASEENSEVEDEEIDEDQENLSGSSSSSSHKSLYEV